MKGVLLLVACCKNYCVLKLAADLCVLISIAIIHYCQNIKRGFPQNNFVIYNFRDVHSYLTNTVSGGATIIFTNSIHRRRHPGGRYKLTRVIMETRSAKI